MKKRNLLFLLGIGMMSLTACQNRITYYSFVPLDKVFAATLVDILKTDYNNPDKKDEITTYYAVSQRYANVAGESRFVTYVEFKQDSDFAGHDDDWGDYEYTYVYFHNEKKSFVLDETNHWVKDETTYSFSFSFSKVYLNQADSDSFRYKMIEPLGGPSYAYPRSFYHRYQTDKTEKYIEYTFQGDEVIRVSNDEYNVCVKYYFDNVKYASFNSQDATWEPGETNVPHINGAKTGEIPHLDTITKEMLEKEDQ